MATIICASHFYGVVNLDRDPDLLGIDTDPDRYQFQANEKVGKLNFFPENISMAHPVRVLL
jgi:hypothetical protein